VARKLKPDSWAPCFYLGKAKLRLEQPAEAVVLLQRAAQLNADEASVHYALAQALQATGRQAEARRAFARVRDLRAAALAATMLQEGQVAGTR
jgi:Flp pilus assembly protein TadD